MSARATPATTSAPPGWGKTMVDRPPLTPVSRPWKIILIILTIAAWLPIGFAFAASGIASSLGCRLNEAGNNPCLLAGHDIGDTLYTMFMMFWLAILTMPLMAISIIGWLVVWVRRAR
jgi:hypothetical protein